MKPGPFSGSRAFAGQQQRRGLDAPMGVLEAGYKGTEHLTVQEYAAGVGVGHEKSRTLLHAPHRTKVRD